MKRFSYILIAAMMLISLGFLACGDANQFGGSFDFIICSDIGCTETADNPEVSVFSGTPLTVYLGFENRMTAGDDTQSAVGQTVRTRRVEIDYFAPPNSMSLADIRRIEHIAVNIDPEETVTSPVTIFSHEQIEFIRDRLGQFPDLPFQISCEITVFYDTTGGITDSVERTLSIQINY